MTKLMSVKMFTEMVAPALDMLHTDAEQFHAKCLASDREQLARFLAANPEGIPELSDTERGMMSGNAR